MPWVVRLRFLLLESVATNWLLLHVLQGSHQRQVRADLKTQKTRAAPPSRRVQMVLMMRHGRLHHNRHRRRTSYSKRSRASTSSSLRCTVRSPRAPRFLSSRVTATHAGCLRSPRAAQNFRRARIRVRGRTVALLLLLMRERRRVVVVVAVPARCGGTRRTIARSRRRLCVRGWVCYSLASRRSVSVTS